MTDRPRHDPSADDSYQDLRGRLISMGYLQKPLERFVLGGIAAPGSFARRHAAVSLKVALVTGPLLGLLMALAVVVVNSPRFSRPLDFLFLTACYALVLGAAVFAFEFGAGLVLATLVRWRGRGVAGFQATAARAGFAVSLAVSAYLALWWRRRVGGVGGVLPDLAGLVVLFLMNAALLRVSSLGSLAALVRVSDRPAGGGAGDASLQATGRNAAEGASRNAAEGAGKFPILTARKSAALATRSSTALLATVAGLLLSLGFFLAPKGLGPAAPSPFERIAVEGRLLVVGWDGITADVFEGLAPLQGAAARSVTVRLMADPEGPGMSRPAFWTEIATGRRPAEHGVEAIVDRHPLGLSSPLGGNVPMGVVLRTLLPGRRVAVSAGLRRARTLWEILGEREGVGVVGWWATWPALDRGQGLPPCAIVSDRALFTLQVPSSEGYRIVPSSLARELNMHFQEDLAGAREAIALALGGNKRKEDQAAEQAAMIDGYATQAALRILADRSLMTVFVYLPGLDIVRSGAGKAPSGAPMDVPGAAVAAGGARAARVARAARADGATGAETGTGAGTRAAAPAPGAPAPAPGAGAAAAAPGAGAAAAAPGAPAPGPGAPAPGAPAPGAGAGAAAAAAVDSLLIEAHAYARYVRGRIERLARELGPQDWLVIVGDPGRAGPSGQGWVQLSGPGAASASMVDGGSWSALDLAPTILNLRGFPRSREMEGTVRTEALDSTWRARLGPRSIETFGTALTPALPAIPETSEEEILSRLRSLGYLN